MKKLLLLCVTLCASFLSTGQESHHSLLRNKLYSGFMEYYKLGTPEKLYIQTDKPYYSAGEDIWFKGFLTNSVTGEISTKSKFIYIELVDATNKVVHKQKIKANDWGFDGKFTLSPEIPVGKYAIKAYTLWMLNWGKDFLFEKKLEIGNLIDHRINIAVSYTLESENNAIAHLLVTDAKNNPMVGRELYYTVNLPTSSSINTFRLVTDQEGKARIKFNAKDIKEDSYIDIKSVYSNLSSVYFRRFVIPEFSDNFDLQFFPEGGAFLAGGPQRVAFKAMAVSGVSEEVTGAIFDANNREVAQFSSSHKGMGYFEMTPEAGAVYYAKAKSASGYSKNIPLPEVRTSGCVLRAERVRDRIMYSVRHSDDVNASHLYVAILSGGKLLKVDKFEPARPIRRFSTKGCPSGIMNIALMDKEGSVLSERLLFIKGDSTPIMNVTTDKADYAGRQQVEMEIHLVDAAGKPLSGQFAMSVTDAGLVARDTLSDNVVSYMLLSSDIKGNIEEPAYYFSSDSPEVNANLDILMMTQGWKRFDLTDIVKRKFSAPEMAHEESYNITGDVTGFFGNAARKPSLALFIPRQRYMDVFKLDKSHKFHISGIDTPDTTTIILHTVGRFGGLFLNLNLNRAEELLPGIKFSRSRLATPPVIPPAYLSQMKEKYYYEGGEKVYMFDEVTVTASRISKVFGIDDVVPTYSIDGRRLEAYANADIYSLLRTLPGVRVKYGSNVFASTTTGYATVWVDGTMPLIYIDGLQMYQIDLEAINMKEIAKIDLVTGPDALLFGFAGDRSYGVISITLKPDASFNRIHPNNFAMITPLGYSRPAEFYNPKYGTPEQKDNQSPDLRTTICWDPHIKVDSTGVARVNFYTADSSTAYDVTLEGVTSNGSPCRYEGKISRGTKDLTLLSKIPSVADQ